MSDPGTWGQSILWLVLAGVSIVACDKPTDSGSGATALAPVASPEAKKTAATIRQVYPIDCDVSTASWKWATCHDTTKGFDALLACTSAARDEAKRAATRLPVATTDTSCAGTVDAKSRAFVTGTAAYLDDVVAWLTAHRAALLGPLHASSIQDLDNDKLKAGMPHEWDTKYGGDVDAGESVRFGWVNDIACTKPLYRCGLSDNPADVTYAACGMLETALWLGVACGSSSPYRRADGKPYCIASICDMGNPRTWLYDATTKERIP